MKNKYRNDIWKGACYIQATLIIMRVMFFIHFKLEEEEGQGGYKLQPICLVLVCNEPVGPSANIFKMLKTADDCMCNHEKFR